MKKYYKLATFYPSMVSFITTIIFTFIENRDYKSEWLTSDTVISMIAIYTIVYLIVMYILCLPIYLVQMKFIHKNKIYIAMCWFLLPMGFITIQFFNTLALKTVDHNSYNSKIIYDILLNLPFIFGLIWTYIKFNKESNETT